MIGFFVLAGDVNVGKTFNLYKEEFNKIVKNFIFGKKYGTGLDILLIEYHLEGKFLKIPEYRYKVNAFRKKESSISVSVYVPTTFEALSDSEKKAFIAHTTLEAIILVRNKMQKSEIIKIDFDSLLHDLKQCSETYIGVSTNG